MAESAKNEKRKQKRKQTLKGKNEKAAELQRQEANAQKKAMRKCLCFFGHEPHGCAFGEAAIELTRRTHR